MGRKFEQPSPEACSPITLTDWNVDGNGSNGLLWKSVTLATAQIRNVCADMLADCTKPVGEFSDRNNPQLPLSTKFTVISVSTSMPSPFSRYGR
jgi:hypothetical protein